MPFVAVPSVKPGVTVKPPGTVMSSVTVNVSPSPSSADVSSMVNSDHGHITTIVHSSVTAGFTPSLAVIVTSYSSPLWDSSRSPPGVPRNSPPEYDSPGGSPVTVTVTVSPSGSVTSTGIGVISRYWEIWGFLPSPLITGGELSVIVPVAVSVAVTVARVSDTLRPTVNVSAGSSAVSSVVATVKLCVSPAVPVKLSPAVFSV